MLALTDNGDTIDDIAELVGVGIDEQWLGSPDPP